MIISSVWHKVGVPPITRALALVLNPFSTSFYDIYVGLVCAYTTPVPHPGYQDRTEHLPDETVMLEEANESLLLKRVRPPMMQDRCRPINRL